VGKNVLVISTVEHADDVLRAHVGEAEAIKVVVPVVRQGVLDWLANDQAAIGHAERVAEHTAEQLPGETVDAGAGEADVGLAIRDALATFPADEIVVAVRPEEEEGFIESGATDTAPQQRHIEGVPVRIVVIAGFPDCANRGSAGCERLPTGLNGNLPSARVARTVCGEKGSNRSGARLASRSSQLLSLASAGGDVLGGRRLLQS
jgi:hypothetical protein